MELCVVVTKEELVALAHELMPMDIALGGGARRVVSLGRPGSIELVASVGLRVQGAAQVTLDVGRLTVPVKVRRWQVLVVPTIDVRGGAHVLALEPTLEALDLGSVPHFVGERLAVALNDALSTQRERLVWNFTRALGVRRSLPERITPPMRFDLTPSGGEVVITSAELRLSVRFRAGMRRPCDREATPVVPSERGARS